MPDTKNLTRILFVTYLAIVSIIGLVMTTVATAQLIDAGLKTWVFQAADIPEWLEDCTLAHDRPIIAEDKETMTAEELFEACQERRTQQIANYQVEKARDAVQNLSIFIVGLPLFLVHFRFFLKERKRNE